MASRSRLWAILCDDAGNKLANIPPLTPKSARLVLSSLDDFPQSEAVFGADDRATIALITPFTTLKFYERDLGLMSWHTIEDPVLAIKDDGDEITLTLPNITDQMTRVSVGLGATFETGIGGIVSTVAGMGESVVWTTNHDAQGNEVSYFAAYPDFTRQYNTLGQVIGLTAGTGKPSAWSAVALDDGANVKSATSVSWIVGGSVAATGNNLAKSNIGAAAYDSLAITPNLLTAVTDASGNAAASDGAFQWSVADVQSQMIAGLGKPNTFATTDVLFGFEILPSPTPKATGATGTWNYWENGVRIAAGFPYSPGDTFAVNVDYSQGVGSPRVVYYHNNFAIKVGGFAPVLPYRPAAFLYAPSSLLENAMLMTTVKPSQQVFAIQFNQQTPLEALLSLANATGYHLRQRRDGTGAPLRALEFGAFGAQSNIRLVGGRKGDLARMAKNPANRVVTALSWQQTSSTVINTITPLGASTGDGQVDLERPWWILFNPRYDNYVGKIGALAYIFPEYDPVNYPIARTLGRNGAWEYWVRDTAAYNRVGFEIRGKYSDPQFQFSSPVVADQELVARALYIATVAKLKFESQINDTLTIETVAAFRPPRAGDRVNVDFRRMGADVQGNFAVMSTQARTNLANPYVASVERTYNEDGSAFDAWKTTFLARNPDAANQNGSAASLRDLEAIKIVPTNETVYLAVYGDGDVDANPNADHSLIVQVRIPREVFRITAAPLDVQFYPLRMQVTTAASSPTPVHVTVPTQNVTISSIHGAHSLTGGTYDATNKGFKSQAKGFAINKPAALSGPVVLTLNVEDKNNYANQNVFVIFKDGQWVLNAPGIAQGVHVTTGSITLTTTDTSHDHVTPLDQAVGVATTLSGTIDQTTLTGTADPHTHPITANLNDVTSSQVIAMDIDPGTGQFTEVTTEVVDQLSGQVGPWGQSFYLPDISKYVSAPGKLVRLRFRPVNNDNFGVGHLKVSGYWRATIGGIGETVFTQTQ